MATEYEIILALSGKDEYQKPKVGTSLFHEYIGSDGSSQQVNALYIEKPALRIYRDYQNMVVLDFVYDYADDVDLIQQYMFLQSFFQPENSVDFDEEQFTKVQSQLNDAEDGNNILHVHCLILNIVSLAPRGKYVLTTTEKPMFYQLIPERPGENAKILRMIFHSEDVIIEEISEAQRNDFLKEGYNDEYQPYMHS